MIIKLYDFSDNYSFTLDGKQIQAYKNLICSKIKIPLAQGKHILCICKNKDKSENTKGLVYDWLSIATGIPDFNLKEKRNDIYTLEVFVEFVITNKNCIITLKHAGEDILCEIENGFVVNKEKRLKKDKNKAKEFRKFYWWPSVIILSIFFMAFIALIIFLFFCRRFLVAGILTVFMIMLGRIFYKSLKNSKVDKN